MAAIGIKIRPVRPDDAGELLDMWRLLVVARTTLQVQRQES